MNSIALRKTSQAVAWVVAIATALAFSAPSASAFVARGNTSAAKWVSQTPGTAAGGATVVNANPGDVLNFSLTVQNTSRTDVFYGANQLIDEAAPYVGAHEIRVGATDDTVYSNIFDFTHGGPFVNNNRFATFMDGQVMPGQNLTMNWALKVKAGIPNGTYRFKVGMVQEYDAWFGDRPGPGAGGPTNNLGGRSGGTIFWDIVIGGSVVTPATGGIGVSLASGTPAAGNIADGASANFTKFTLTPASGASVSLTSLYVTRSGLSTDTQVENVQLIRASDGVQMGNTAGGFDSSHRAQIFFSPAMVLTSATDFYIRAGIVDGSQAGNTVALGVASNSDVVSNATGVTGAPATGNLMTIVALTIGTVTLAEFGSVADSTPDGGDKDVVTNTFQLTAGSTEDISVEQITVLKAGTAGVTDTNTIELWNDTTNATVGTNASWNAENKAVFNFSPALMIAKGNTVRFTVRVDIVSGAGLTVNSDIVDGSTALVVAKGLLYGYYITPTVSGGWAGTGDNAQTINSGALVISKSAASVATGNVTQADNQVLGTWDFDARGEEIRISELNVNLAFADDFATGDITNARLYDAAGNLVAGPVDGSAEVGVSDREIDFTQTFIVPVGVHQYTLKARVATTAGDDADATADTIAATITAAGDVIAKTVRTNTSVTATGVPATLNTQTVRAAAIAATTLTTPAARQIAEGITDFVFATAALNASGSGEDVRVSAIQFEVVTANQADPDSLVNIEVWADLTSANSGRGDKFETKVSNTEQIDGDPAATVDFSITLTQALTIKKDSFTEIAVVGDIQPGVFTVAGDNDTFTVSIDDTANDVTAVGVDTGSTVAVTASGAGQAMTVVAGGTVTVTVDSSSPQSDILVGGSAGKTIAVYRAVTNAVEAVELDQMVVTNASTGDENTGTWYLYSNRDGNGNLVTPFLAASAPNGATPTFNLNNSVVRIPADSVALFTIKADILAVDGTAVVNGDVVDTNLADLTAAAATAASDVDFTGLASGALVPGTGTDGITNADHELYKSRPYVSFAADSPSGALTPTAAGSVTGLVAKINILADAAFDIAFTNDDANHDATDSSVVISINSVVTDDAVDSGGFSFVDMSTSTVVDSATSDIEAAVDTICDFSTADMFVAAGQTKTLAVYADTQAYEDSGDSLQIWLSDAADANFEFGTTITADSAANGHDVGFIVLRGDKFGGTLVKA